MKEVEDAVAAHAIVVVGMSQNPFPRKARKLLDGAGLPYHYLEYGSYLKRLAPAAGDQDVDRLADVSDGVREGHADRRGG